jgi:hypothetical protein
MCSPFLFLSFQIQLGKVDFYFIPILSVVVNYSTMKKASVFLDFLRDDICHPLSALRNNGLQAKPKAGGIPTLVESPHIDGKPIFRRGKVFLQKVG